MEHYVAKYTLKECQIKMQQNFYTPKSQIKMQLKYSVLQYLALDERLQGK